MCSGDRQYSGHCVCTTHNYKQCRKYNCSLSCHRAKIENVQTRYLSENTFSYLTPWQHSMYHVVVILHLSHHLPWPAGLMCKFNESQNMHGPPPRPGAQISPPHTVINTPSSWHAGGGDMYSADGHTLTWHFKWMF